MLLIIKITLYGFIILVYLILVYIMLQRFENFKKNKDKNINKTKVEYNLYNFSIQTIYTGHQFESLINMSFINIIDFENPESVYTNYGCVIFYKNNDINLYKLNNIKNFLQALALISYVYNFKTKSE